MLGLGVEGCGTGFGVLGLRALVGGFRVSVFFFFKGSFPTARGTGYGFWGLEFRV